MDQKLISGLFAESARLIAECGERHAMLIHKIAQELIACFERGGKLLIFGNGGSASQAQHFAAELVNKLARYRQALPALSLVTDSSVLTSIGNDLDFSHIFSRQIEAHACRGDVAWGLSTSGRSPNVLEAVTAAHAAGLVTVCFTGPEGNRLAELADLCLTVASHNTARIQEVHQCAGHAVCEIVESHFLHTT